MVVLRLLCGLATSGPARVDRGDLPGVLLAVGLLIAAVVVLAMVLTYMRRRLLANEQRSAPMGILEELRRLHESGELSDEEYQTARQRMISRLKGESTSPAQPSPRTDGSRGDG